MKKTIIFLLAGLLSILFGFQCIHGNPGDNKATPGKQSLPADLDSIAKDLFNGADGAFVIYDQNNKTFSRYNKQRCAQRFTPCSTFKIPNSLIALETGVVKDADFVIPWDSQKYPAQKWWKTSGLDWGKDHNLRSAIKNSVVWYYREVAKKIGTERMKRHLEEIDYGNNDISGGIDIFWLSSSLKISADEQVAFLDKFYRNKLGFTKRSTDIVKDILFLESLNGSRLSAKTGGGTTPDGKAIGWFVGYVERDNNVYFFALNIKGENYMAIKDKRISITKKIFSRLFKN